MGVDIHIKPSVSEVRVDVDESNNSDEDNSISSDDVYIKENEMYVTIDVSRYEDIDRDNLEISLTGGGEVLQLLRKNQISHSGISYFHTPPLEISSGKSTTAYWT